MSVNQDCICASLPDLANVPMGGDGLDERLLATLESVKEHGGGQWWLYLGKCNACGQDWLVAQEERIYDEHFLQRLRPSVAADIVATGRWPDTFITYERVLQVGKLLAKPCRFFDPMAASLIWTVEDLRTERADISGEDISDLLGVSEKHVAKLIGASGALASKGVWERVLTWVKLAHGNIQKLFDRR